MSCTARSITTPTFDMRGGNGPTRVMPMERISSPLIASLMACTAGLNRSTWPTISVTPFRRAAAMMSGPPRRWRRSASRPGRGFRGRCRSTRCRMVQVRRCGDGHGIDAERRAGRRGCPPPGSPATRLTSSRCRGSGSAVPTSFMPASPARTRAWLEPMMPAPTTPTRSVLGRAAFRGTHHDPENFPFQQDRAAGPGQRGWARIVLDSNNSPADGPQRIGSRALAAAALARPPAAGDAAWG